MTDFVPKPGWLKRQFREVCIEVATWPESMRRQSAAGDDSLLTSEERKEAARRLRARADELDPMGAMDTHVATGPEGRTHQHSLRLCICRKLYALTKLDPLSSGVYKEALLLLEKLKY